MDIVNLYQLENIEHRYTRKPVLTIDHWEIPAKSAVGLAGPNGSGKSTLLRLLGFVERPRQGQILFDGNKADLYANQLRTQVTLLPQHSHLLKRSVYKNIAYGLRLRKDCQNEHQRVCQALTWVGLKPERFAHRPWFALSGGEARRVALAARLVLKPRVFLLDEPTTSVDAASAHMIKESIFRARQEWNTTLIVSSHDMEWLNDICNSMLYLFRGRVMESGQPTLMFGPWETTNDGMVYKTIAENERVIAPPPPTDAANAIAAIDADQLVLHANKEQISKRLRCLKGMLVRLGLEKVSGNINATVVVGSLTLHISLPMNNPTSPMLTPGQTVWIGYDPADIQWMG